MLEGVANLTPVFWNLAGTVNHLLNLTQLHHFLLEILANVLVNIAGMAQNKVFVSSPELLARARWLLLFIFEIIPCLLYDFRNFYIVGILKIEPSYYRNISNLC